MATDAITGFLEGLTSGFERGTTLRRQRTFDQQQAEELQRKQIAEQIEAGRQAVLDQQNADRAAREAAKFQLGTGLAPQTQPLTPTGAVPDAVSDLRRDVAQEIAPTDQIPAGFRRVGPSAGERETEQTRALRANVGRFMAATPEEREEMSGDPAMIAALQELGQFGGVFERRTAGPAPSTARFGVTAEGGRTLTGATEEEAEAFARRQPTAPTGAGRPQALTLLGEVGASEDELAFAETLDDDELEKFASDRLKSSKVNPTEAERRAAAVFPRAERGFQEITELVESFGGAPGLSTLFGRGFIARFGQREDIQRFQVAGRAVVSAFLRFESGAAISQKEFDDAIETFIPQLNDKTETVEFKLEIMRVQLEALGRAAELVTGEVARFDNEEQVIEDLLDQGLDDDEIERRLLILRQRR